MEFPLAAPPLDHMCCPVCSCLTRDNWLDVIRYVSERVCCTTSRGPPSIYFHPVGSSSLHVREFSVSTTARGGGGAYVGIHMCEFPVCLVDVWHAAVPRVPSRFLGVGMCPPRTKACPGTPVSQLSLRADRQRDSGTRRPP